jgi:hypothetical protein
MALGAQVLQHNLLPCDGGPCQLTHFSYPRVLRLTLACRYTKPTTPGYLTAGRNANEHRRKYSSGSNHAELSSSPKVSRDRIGRSRRALASLAFRDAYGVSQSSRERILATAARTGYQPNRVAARLASKAVDTLGVFLLDLYNLDLYNEVFADMFDGMREAAHQSGRDLVLTVGSISGALDRPALDSLVRARVDVTIAAGLLLPDADLAAIVVRLPLVSVVSTLSHRIMNSVQPRPWSTCSP